MKLTNISWDNSKHRYEVSFRKDKKRYRLGLFSDLLYAIQFLNQAKVALTNEGQEGFENHLKTKRSFKEKDNYRGVAYMRKKRKWKARIQVKGKIYHLGYFASPHIAAEAYDYIAIKIHRKVLNFPPNGRHPNSEAEREYLKIRKNARTRNKFSFRHLKPELSDKFWQNGLDELSTKVLKGDELDHSVDTVLAYEEKFMDEMLETSKKKDADTMTD